MQQEFDWKERYKDKIADAAFAIKSVKPGNSIFIGTGCAQPQHLVNALVEYSSHIYDAHIVHLLTVGDAPYTDEKLSEKFKMNSFFIADNVRHSLAKGIGDYTPIFLSEIPDEFESGRIPLDVALITVTPPDANGLCSLGVSVDIIKSAVANSHYVIAQVNSKMPRTYGDSFLHVNNIDMLVPLDEPIVEIPERETDETLKRIGQNIGMLVEDGSTIECGIGRIPQALAEFLKDKKDLGVHTEMFSDWIIDLIECGAITCSKKTVNRNKVVASFCMGSKRLYDFIDHNPFFEFRPTEYVNDINVIAQHEKMVGINVGLEVDLTGQVCADSLGYQFYSGIGGQVDFIRGCARSRGGKPIIALPSTAKNNTISRIVPHLTEGAGVVTTRGDVHYVVTEFGVAYLHGKSIRERALALINIAHPKFRNELLQAAKKHRYVYEDQIELSWDQIEYPKQLERYETLRDGTEIFFRPVKPTDESAISEMLYSLSEESVRKRYMTRTVAFPHKDVQQLANVDYQNTLAIVGVVPSVNGEEIVAIGEYFLEPRQGDAEVAFLVQDEWQKKGMGTLLIKFLSETARKREVKSFHAKVLPQNKAMLSVFYNSGYNITTEFDGEVYDLRYDLNDLQKK
ncbi:GNAT family N-acetyltransferase [candidate division KSB1 bacterium]|nr:GNAT family N-acetyltransferase [candidate division KSB1 bacterium]RQW05232.1 MAG: GNAT family N-acetyltransferase [candidate division KSB1 bacterium]